MSDALRGLSLLQPWASLVAVGAKTVETRSWRTDYRGPVAIHASKRWQHQLRTLCYDEPFRSALAPHFAWTADGLDLPTGAVVAVATLTACIETDTTGLWAKAMPKRGTPEHAFGDFTAGRYAWFLSDVRRLRSPIPCGGALGMWAVDAAVRAQIEAALAVAR